jgi:hypothetical protein
MAGAGYQPHFDIDFQRGLVGEKLVGTFLESLSGSLIEVKTDYRAHETGNVYVEGWQQNLEGEWYKSGINATHADWFVYAGPQGRGFIAMRTEDLMELAKASPRAEITTHNANTRQTRGRIVRLTDMIETIFRKGN